VRTILAALVLLVSALIQGPPREPRTPAAAPSGSGGIRGRVIAADTRAPIRGALVTIATRGMVLTIYTDARGRYELRDLAPGSYSLRAEPNQHQAQFFSPNLRPVSDAAALLRVAVFDGQISEAEDLNLPRAGAIVGRIVDERGDPISSVQATALHPDDRSGSAGYYLSQASDDLGRYRVFHLPPGEYVIVVRPSGGIGPLVQGQSLGFIETYHPGTQSRDEAARVRVRAGEETDAGDLPLTPARMVSVTGLVLDSHGAPAPSRTTISLNSDSSGNRRTVDGQGRFFFLPQQPGRYRLTASLRDEAGEATVEYASIPVTLVDENLEDVTLAMKPTVSRAGRVLLEPSPGSPLAAGALAIVARSKERSTLGELFVSPAPVAPDLSFTLRGLAGQILLRPNGRVMNNWFLKAVLLGNQDITDVPTEFREGESARLQIVLTTRASELGGTVTGDKGEPVANCNVVLFSEDKAGWFPWSSRFHTLRPDRDGRFSIKGLRSGRYYLIALPPERSFNAQSIDSATLESLVKDATILVLGEDEQRQVDLKVAATGGG
jgi:hypothetical protein